MQRADLVVGAIRHISSRLGANTLISNVKSIYQPDPSDSFVEFRSHPRSCEEWEKDVLEVYTQSSNGDYASQRSRIGRERVHELRAYKDHASDNLFHYLVAEISTNQSPGHCVYMRLRMTISDSSTVTTVVKRLESWPRNDALLVEQTCFTDRLPVLLDLILLGPIVYSMSARYVTIDFEFFFADLILRAFQELFRHTCPRRESRYIDPTFVILETRSTGKQRERCFVLPFRSKLLDEIEPLFARRRREFGLKVRIFGVMN
ncbi:hypothetical protein H0H93_016768 [Arthromyces matolae]|nr:hypothetical protein H0H93_016768 [Arthromyces matolae]